MHNNKGLFGLKSFDPTKYKKDEVLAALFLHLAFNDWKLIVKRMNVAVDLHNNNKSKKNVSFDMLFSFLILFALLV
jgi:hypothetical protein